MLQPLIGEAIMVHQYKLNGYNIVLDSLLRLHM